MSLVKNREEEIFLKEKYVEEQEKELNLDKEILYRLKNELDFYKSIEIGNCFAFKNFIYSIISLDRNNEDSLTWKAKAMQIVNLDDKGFAIRNNLEISLHDLLYLKKVSIDQFNSWTDSIKEIIGT